MIMTWMHSRSSSVNRVVSIERLNSMRHFVLFIALLINQSTQVMKSINACRHAS